MGYTAGFYCARNGAVAGGAATGAGCAIGAGVTGAVTVGGVSLMPRGNRLSLVWLRSDVEPPAAAWPKVFWIATAGLCCTVVVLVVVVTTPFTCVVPAGVTSGPPVRAVAICCAVGAAMPRVI